MDQLIDELIADAIKDKQLRIKELIRENNRYVRYVNAYGNTGGDCKSCGEITHPGFVCFHCGRDNSYTNEEWNAR